MSSVYVYTALDRQGRQTSGTVPAQNRSEAMDQIISQGLSPVELREQAGDRGGTQSKATTAATATNTRVPASAIESFTRELANLLAAGLPLSRALHLLKREASHHGARHVWGQIHDDVVGGMPLADALGKWPRTFSTVYIAMVRAGEIGGFLSIVLQQIADFRTREQELKGKVKAALVYPCLLSVFGTAVVIFLLTWFLPKMSGIFDEFGGNLPYLTQGIVGVSNWLKTYGVFLAIGAVFGGYALRKYATTDAGRRVLENIVLHLPAVGRVSAQFALVRFARMLGTLVGAGVPLVNALRVAKEALGNQTLADTVSNAIDQVRRGVALSRSLSGSTLLFPPSVIEMISVAEETGRLDKELLRLSTSYEADLDRNLRMLVSLAEPLLLMIMAAIIGTVVVGMLLPVFTLQDLIK